MMIIFDHKSKKTKTRTWTFSSNSCQQLAYILHKRMQLLCVLVLAFILNSWGPSQHKNFLKRATIGMSAKRYSNGVSLLYWCDSVSLLYAGLESHVGQSKHYIFSNCGSNSCTFGSILESSGDFDYCSYTMRLNANIIPWCLVVFHNWYPLNLNNWRIFCIIDECFLNNGAAIDKISASLSERYLNSLRRICSLCDMRCIVWWQH